MGTAIIKHPVPDRVKSRHLTSGLSGTQYCSYVTYASINGWCVECPDVKNSEITIDGLTRSGTGCSTHMTTVDVKGLNTITSQNQESHITG